MGLADLDSKRYLMVQRAMRLAIRFFVHFSIVFSGLVAAIICGCAPSNESSSKTEVYRLLWPSASGDYSFQDVSLSTFREPDSLRGDVAEILVDPKISGGTVIGEEPIGRWVRDGSRRIPADFVTLQAAVIYAHLEKLAEIDANLGLAGAMNGRSRVGLLARVSEKPSAPMITNNAIYDGTLDILFIVPYLTNRNQPVSLQLPVSMNAGILGHEHFHRVFQSIISNPIHETGRTGSATGRSLEALHELPGCSWQNENSIVLNQDAAITTLPSVPVNQTAAAFEPVQIVPRKVFNQTLLRGINEGYADFWGWAYSRDEDFVARSVGASEDALRRIDKPASSIPLKATLRGSLITDVGGIPTLKSERGQVAAAYRFGTEYARILRGFTEVLIRDAKQDRDQAIASVRQALASSLRELSSEIAEKWGREELDPELLLKPTLVKLLRMSPSGPAVLDASASIAVCKELERLNASAGLKQGLCGSPTGAAR